MSRMLNDASSDGDGFQNFQLLFCNFQLGSVSRFFSDNIVIMAACIRSSGNPDVR
jgi:hypothetical protein